MQNLKTFVAAAIGIFVFLFATSSMTPQSAKADAKKEVRAFYLTMAARAGGQASTACAAGFHMASLWEILDPSNLRYENTVGFTRADSGSGPPNYSLADAGWVRTGSNAQTDGIPGTMNCDAWTNSAATAHGTLAGLRVDWDPAFVNDPVSPIGPWKATGDACSVAHRVWCVED